MLYIGFMNVKPTLPDEVDPRTKEFSLRAQWKVNHWAYVAIVLSLSGLYMLGTVIFNRRDK
jgi:hypothetical protein